MSLGEFEIIRRYFDRRGTGAAAWRAEPDAERGVLLGIGDDAAVIDPDGPLVVTTDMLVEGVHFLAGMAADALGYRALAVSLSDLAAMGAAPRWALLAMSVEQAEARWLERFAAGLFELADRHGVALIGGDLTRGPLTVTVQLIGTARGGRFLTRAGGRVGDDVYVTGSLGDAAAGIELLSRRAAEDHTEDPPFRAREADWARAALEARLLRPTPRVAEGLALAEVASAAIDVSDGLLADLGHILEASGVGATLWLGRMPLSDAFRKCIDNLGRDRIENLARRLHCDDPADVAVALALTAGDDYELCFTTAPAAAVDTIAGLRCTGIGVIESAPGLRCLRPDGTSWRPGAAGYDHFSGEQADGDVRA
jgi:thiamine-monophosphate kinase